MPKKRADGLQERKVTINGKRVSVYGHSTEELDRKAAKLREEAEQGIKADRTMTLDKMYQVWKRNKSAKESTIRFYDKHYKTISKHIGSMKLTDITANTCDDLKEKLKKEEVIWKGKQNRGTLTTTGINNKLAVLKGVLKLAKDRRLIAYNPMDSIARLKRTEPKMRDSKHRALTHEELQLFLEESKNSSFHNIMKFMACTGMRVGEAGALTWGDISEGQASVTKSVTVKNGKVASGNTPKTESSNRLVPLNETAQKVLTDQKKRMMMLKGGSALTDEAPVFPKDNGELVDCVAVNTCINKLLERINRDGIRIEPFTSHCFRHTFATECVNQGMNPPVLQKILGHATLAMTMDTYYHTNEGQKQEEMQKIRFAF